MKKASENYKKVKQGATAVTKLTFQIDLKDTVHKTLGDHKNKDYQQIQCKFVLFAYCSLNILASTKYTIMPELIFIAFIVLVFCSNFGLSI